MVAKAVEDIAPVANAATAAEATPTAPEEPVKKSKSHSRRRPLTAQLKRHEKKPEPDEQELRNNTFGSRTPGGRTRPTRSKAETKRIIEQSALRLTQRDPHSADSWESQQKRLQEWRAKVEAKHQRIAELPCLLVNFLRPCLLGGGPGGEGVPSLVTMVLCCSVDKGGNHNETDRSLQAGEKYAMIRTDEKANAVATSPRVRSPRSPRVKSPRSRLR